jgi:hypothetical protein
MRDCALPSGQRIDCPGRGGDYATFYKWILSIGTSHLFDRVLGVLLCYPEMQIRYCLTYLAALTRSIRSGS